jgi:N-acetylmuramoyl-L-alanine amidase
MRKWSIVIVSILVILLMMSACSSGNQALSGDTDTSKERGATGGKRMNEVNKVSSDKPAGPVYKVVIDPGHGGEDPGATAVNGRYEKEFTLSMSKEIVALLEQNPQIQVEMTRTEDTFISSEELYRSRFANELEADLFISIHGNTFDEASVSGTESFYYHDESQAFADIIHKHVVKATGFKDRGVKQESYFVLRETNMPAVLLELGYLTNPHNEGEMWTPAFQQSVAAAIYEGIKEYLQIN